MNRDCTPDQLEAEADRLRGELITAGAAIRRRTSPTALVTAVKAKVKQETEGAVAELARKSADINLLLLGGGIGAAVVTLGRRSGDRTILAPPMAHSSSKSVSPSPTLPFSQKAKAAALSGLGLGLGYLAGSTVPRTSVEDEVLAEPAAAIKRQVADFASAHAEGMKRSAANLFGLSRIAAGLLAVMAVVADRAGAGVASRPAGRLPG